jgi:hypothetical protein
MVVQTAPQLRSSYLLWERFNMPTEGGPRDAIAVPSYVGNQLISAYTIMVGLIFVNTWGILIALGTLWAVRHAKKKEDYNNELTVSLWNTRDTPGNAVRDVVAYMYTKKRFRHVWLYLVLLILVFLWVANTALSIIIPRYIVLDNAAPVNPEAIFMPALNGDTEERLTATFNLEVAPSFRAAGSAQVADEDLQSRVRVSEPILIEDLGDGEAVQRVEYSYNVTGVDFGLQHHPDLELRVEGACTTEYGWYVDTVEASGTTIDIYEDPFDESEVRRSLFDGPRPVALFSQQRDTNEASSGNISWAIFVSSVNRYSWTVGTDPLYLTVPSDVTDPGTAANIVAEGRPALSCWQRDAWWYHDEWRSATEVTDLPGLNMRSGIENVILRWLSTPVIVNLGTRLGGSALVSSGTALGQIIDAGASSMHTDLQRLVLASYILTSNVFTDMTQFLTHDGVSNAALNPETNELYDGTNDFVVWTPDAQALSILFVIVVPCLALGIWLMAITLLLASPVGILRKFGTAEIYRAWQAAQQTVGAALGVEVQMEEEDQEERQAGGQDQRNGASEKRVVSQTK